MIKYRLRCEASHQFEGWFGDSADYDRQSAAGLLECPVCGSAAVSKAIMAPAVASAESRDARLAELRRTIAAAAARARDYVERNFDYVGDRFPEEARRIHYGEAPSRGIFGEASGDDVRQLVEEGIDIAPLPVAAPPAGATVHAPAQLAVNAAPGKKPVN